MKYTLLAALLAVLTGVPGYAADGHGAHGTHGVAPTAAATDGLSDGTVRKLDKVKGTVTLAHGPLPNLAMDPMTMAFAVKDPAWLDQWQPGDKIRFFADMVKGRLTVMRWEADR
ncbi:hypothetical protein B9N43_15720 [Denitratisoma sp. DHT3]|uniref:copper-binding protein n=1 Tax=Denitratisoma sp. DHT3 TaxID=1981880 RepID=UPI001198954E|nr:copper-binding protein [Denitratisoma sp. DHT3]QDX82554.1 hypothetical protein B9N43_15720 [Denitratisoma sp. DHT3]